MSKYILGIDLGTTKTVASIWIENNYKIIENKKSLFFPSIIEFTQNGKVISSNSNNLEYSIKNIKRLIGHDMNDVKLFKYLSNLNYDYEITNNQIKFYNKYEDKYYSIEELNALILKKVVSSAESQLKCEIKDVVITIPAHFNQIQRDSVIVSSKIAKLNCIRIINEPTSAALAYGLNYHNDINILIFDLGGGTFDLSLLNIDDGLYEVINTEGDNFLGGEDFTNLILKDVIKTFKDTNKFYKLNDNIIKKEINKLKEYCEKFKCNEIEYISIKKFYYDEKNNIELDLLYNRKRNQISDIFSSLLDRIKEYLDIILSGSNLRKDEIEYVVLVGGSSKLFEIKKLVTEYFNKEPISTIDPELVVSVGAAIQGYIIKNPDDVFSENIALVDILPLSIGVETNNGNMTKIIDKGVKLPIKKYKYFTNEEDNQQEVEIKIYQGERLFIKDNILIGTFELNNLKMKQKGENVIKIEIEVDNNCMINVSAYERGTNNYKKIQIKKSEIYDDKAIYDMIEEADKYEKIDTYKLKLNNTRNKLNRQIVNLKYNCYDNKLNNFNEEDKSILSKYLNRLIEKKTILDNKINNNLSDNDYSDIILNYKKLIKLNESKYNSLICNYDIKEDIKEDKGKYENTNTDEYNIYLKQFISNKIGEINKLNNLSKYSKQLINNYLKNITYLLESKNIDENELNDNINNINENIKLYMNNDIEIIKHYGNYKFLNEFINKQNIDFTLNNFSKFSELQYFDLLFDLSIKYNIQIE